MFTRILSSLMAATAIAAAAPAFATDPFDGPGWPASVGDTRAAPVPNAATACADVVRCCGRAAELKNAPAAREETKASGAYDPFDRSQDSGG